MEKTQSPITTCIRDGRLKPCWPRVLLPSLGFGPPLWQKEFACQDAVTLFLCSHVGH